MSILFIIFAAVVVLGPLVALHEYGHFWVARKLGVKVLTYSIGFGPSLWNKKGKDGVDYRISAIPLGGYVRMLDEREAEVAEEEKHLAFNNQKAWKKILIVAAGPAMNFLIAIVVFWLLLIPASQQVSMRIHTVLPNTPAASAGIQAGDKVVAVHGESVDTWRRLQLKLMFHMGDNSTIPLNVERAGKIIPTELKVTDFLTDMQRDFESQLGFWQYKPHVPAVVGQFVKNSIAARQGFQVGDQIVAINNQPVSDWYDMSERVSNNPQKLLSFQVKRGDKTVQLEAIPRTVKQDSGKQVGRLGIGPDVNKIHLPEAYKETLDYDTITALKMSLSDTYDLSKLTLISLGKMLTGKLGLENLSGPITIAKVSGDMMSIGWKPLLSFMALMSVSLGVLNLLPIPVLDGGHLVYYIYEAIAGKPLPENVQMMGLNIGMLLMLGFMILAIGNDIARLF